MDWPTTVGGNRFSTVGTVAGTSAGTVVTAGAANGTGNWAPLSTATPCSASGLTLIFNCPSATVASHLVDIGIGTAGFELVIIPSIIITHGVADIPIVMYFPVRIPAGVRLSARTTCSASSITVTVSAILHAAVWSSPIPNQRVVAWKAGAPLASRGTPIDPGATANTKPASWTTMAAATTESARGLIVGLGNAADTSRVAPAHWLIDIGVGAAASEQTLIANYYARASVSETVLPGLSPVFPISLPAGVRLAARCQSNNITSGDRALDLVLYLIV